MTVEVRCAMKLAFAVADQNKNGTIEWEEFLLMNTPNADLSVAGIGPRLKELFEKADTSGDGAIDFNEFAQFLGLSEQDREHGAAIFALIDGNGDGKINYEQFQQWSQTL